MADQADPFDVRDNGCEIRLRVTPKASLGAIGEVVADGQGNGALKVAVTAVPADGRANTD